MIKLHDFSMAYSENGEGQPLLFVHGYPLNRRMWQPQIDGLADMARVIAPDLRGHGDSQAVPGPYSMDLLADDLNALLDALHISQTVYLCGLSMGGYVAFAFYRRYAQRLAGLILAATRAAADSAQARASREQAAQTARQQGVAAIVEGMAAKMLSPQTVEQRPALAVQVKEIMLRTSLEGVLGDLEGMKERPDSTPTLSQITIPTLVIHGADDQIIPLAEAQAMQAAIPNARMEIIAGAGHLLNLEQAETFNAAVRGFVTR